RTTGVDRGAAHGQRIDASVRARIPTRGQTGTRIERGDAGARLPANVDEVAAHVDRAPAHGESADSRIPFLAVRLRIARVRVPGRGGAGGRVQRGDGVARLPANAAEIAADVDRS